MKNLYTLLLFAAFFLNVGVENTANSQDTMRFRNRNAIERSELLPETSWLVVSDGLEQRIITIQDGMNCAYRTFNNVAMTNIEVHGANFNNARFDNVDFRQAIFVDCDFSNAEFTNVRCDGYTCFQDCKFDGAVLRGFDPGEYPYRTTYKELSENSNNSVILEYAKRRFVNCGDVNPMDFSDILLKGSFIALEGKQVEKTANVRLKKYADICIFNQDESSSFQGFDFSDSLISSSSFINVDFTDAVFENAVLDNVHFDNCTLSIDQIRATWNYKNGHMEKIWLPDEIQAVVDWEDFRNSKSYQIKKLTNADSLVRLSMTSKGGEASNLVQRFLEEATLYLRREKLVALASDLSSDKKCLCYNSLKNWNLRDFDLSGTYVVAHNFANADFQDSVINNVCFVSLKKVNQSQDELFSKKQLESTKSYKEKDLKGMFFSNICDIRGVDFSGCDLSNSVFRTDLTGVNFEDAIITGCVFDVDAIIPPDQHYSDFSFDSERKKQNNQYRSQYLSELRNQLNKTWNYKMNEMDSVVFPISRGNARLTITR